MFDLHREAAARRPGVLAKGVSLDGVRRSGPAGLRDEPCGKAAEPIVRKSSSTAKQWLSFKSIAPQIAIIRATTADEGAAA